MKWSDGIKEKKWAVLGAERSGIAAAQLLKQNGADVLLSEKKTEASYTAKQDNPHEGMHRIDVLRKQGVRIEFGGHSDDVLSADVVVISPGIPSSVAIVKALMEKQIPVISEIELAGSFCKAPILAITGTDGKTTTTSLAAKMLARDAAERGAIALALGNIGTSFSDRVQELDEDDVAVIEVSSFQLDHCYHFRPKVSVITNITPNHLDRYENSFEKYAEAKFRLFQAQRAEDVVIYNRDNEVLQEKFSVLKRHTPRPFRILSFGLNSPLPRDEEGGGYVENGILTLEFNGVKESLLEEEIILKSIHFRGKHNAYNSLAAAIASRALEVRKEIIRESIQSFEGVEHRIEFVREHRGVRYYNDSKSTTVNALWYALDTIPEKIVLILGGRDKGNDYDKVKDVVAKKVKLIIAIGESQENIVAAFSGVISVLKAATLSEAVETAVHAALPGEQVLLSPACASYDMFQNFEDRGRQFKKLVHALS